MRACHASARFMPGRKSAKDTHSKNPESAERLPDSKPQGGDGSPQRMTGSSSGCRVRWYCRYIRREIRALHGDENGSRLPPGCRHAFPCTTLGQGRKGQERERERGNEKELEVSVEYHTGPEFQGGGVDSAMQSDWGNTSPLKSGSLHEVCLCVFE